MVTDEAFDELLERVERVERVPLDPDPDPSRRHDFVLAVERAVEKVTTRRDRRAWYAQTLRRFGCRLHFFVSEGIVYLVACVDAEERAPEVEDYST